MSIKTIKHDRLDLKIPEFKCDHGYNEKLNNIPMLSHLNNYGFNVLCGKSGSGKTSLLVSFLTGKSENKVYRKCFDNVVVVMPTNSRQSLKKNIFEHHPQNKLFDELNLESITKIYEMLEEAVSEEPKKNTLLILDDVGASLKKKEILFLLKKIIFNRRHLRCHIICLIQSYISLPLEIRKLSSNVIMFKPSKVEAENFFRELFETQKDMMDKIIKYVYKRKGDYLFLNVDSQKMYKDFDEIVIEDGEDSDCGCDD
jgi:ABC-type molybdate transport system ATPase subunit